MFVKQSECLTTQMFGFCFATNSQTIFSIQKDMYTFTAVPYVLLSIDTHEYLPCLSLVISLLWYRPCSAGLSTQPS